MTQLIFRWVIIKHTDIPNTVLDSSVGLQASFCSKVDFTSSEESTNNNGDFLTDSEDAHTPLNFDIVIDNINGQRVANSSRDFSWVIGRKYCNTWSVWWLLHPPFLMINSIQ